MKDKTKNYSLLNISLILMLMFIIAIHTQLLSGDGISFYFQNMLFRLAVPFLTMYAGFYLSSIITNDNRFTIIKKMVFVYLCSSLVYILLNCCLNNDFTIDYLLNNFWQLIIGNSWTIISLLGSIIISTIIVTHLKSNKYLKYCIGIFLILYLVGLVFNTYNFISFDSVISNFTNFFVTKFNNNNNFLFSGTLFFSIGYYLEREKKFHNISKKYNIAVIIGLILTFVALFFEVSIVKKHISLLSNYEYYLSFIFILPLLFVLLINSKLNEKLPVNKDLSALVGIGYIIHFFIIQLFDIFIGKLNNVVYFIIISLITILFSLIILKLAKKKNKEFNVLYLCLYVIVGLIILDALFKIINIVIWGDEVCSLMMTKHTFSSIVNLQVQDVHPPLYYFMLKIFDSIMKLIVNKNPIIIGKVFSFIPLLILLVFDVTKIRKSFGNLTASLFALFLVGMPNMLQYFLEIRMYSWALCFVTIAFVYLFDILKTNNNKSWILFVIFCLLSAYTHLYACLAICLMFLFLLINFLIKKDKNCLKKWFIFGMITFVLYIPWIIALFRQLMIIGSDGYWIEPITWKNIPEYINFIFFAETSDVLSKSMIGILLILLYVMVLIYNIKNKNPEERKFIYMGLLVMILTMGIGIFVSIVKTPVFVSRYMQPTFGCLWLSFSIGLSFLMKKNNWNILLLFIPLTVIATNVNTFTRYENMLESRLETFFEAQDELKGNTIITNYNHIEELLSYYHRDNTIYLYSEINHNMIKGLYGNLKDNLNADQVKDLVENNETVYFVLQDNTIDLNKELENTNICIEKLQSFSEDWYYMSLNRLYVCENN